MGPRQHPTPASLRGELVEAIEAARGVVEPAPLRAALAAIDDPWRIAVVGRTSAGKSTLVGLLAGAPRPVGLGGVTPAVEEVALADGGVVLDTPGIDDPDDAVLTLAPALAAVDAVVWVVDGLQPMTASERAVLREVLPEAAPIWVVVSKIDLVDPEEHGAVVGRVRELAGAARQVVGLDLRRAQPAEVAAFGRCDPPGPRRAGVVRGAVARIRALLRAIPVPLAPEEVETRVRERLQAVVRDVDARIAAGAVDDAHGAEIALREGIEAALADGLAGTWPAGEGPRLGLPEVGRRSVLAQVRDELAGAEAARRAVKAAAARWLQEVQWTLHDGWAGAEAAKARAAARRRLEAALDGVVAGLP